MSAGSAFHALKGRVAHRRGLRAEALENYQAAWEKSNKSDFELAYKLGQAALAVEELGSAAEAFRSATALRPESTESWYRLGFALERGKNPEEAIEAYEKAAQLDPSDTRLQFRSARCYQQLGRNDDAISSYHAAIRGGFNESEAFAAIYTLERRLPAWKRLQTLKAGEPYRQNDFRWALDIAQLELHMRHFEPAAAAYERAMGLGRLSERDAVDHAIALLESGKQKQADELLDATARSTAGEPAEFGPGVFMAKRGRWRDAIRLTRERLELADSTATEARLCFDIAHAYDRQYLHEDAVEWFRRSVELDRIQPYRHYRLGVALERLEHFEHAAAAYSYALSLEPNRTHWWFRLGNAFASMGDKYAAIDAYMRSLGHAEWEPPHTEGATAVFGGEESIVEDLSEGSTNSPEYVPAHERLAADYLRDTVEARVRRRPTDPRAWAELAALEDNDLDSKLHATLEELRRSTGVSAKKRIQTAELMIEAGRLDDAIDILRSSRKFPLPDGLDLKRYTNTAEKHRRALFAETQTRYGIAPRKVLLESNHGASMGCHPLALFREMSSDSRFDGFTYIWARTARCAVPEEIASREDVLLVTLHSDEYLYHLATAEYLINNVSFAPYFVRRPGQKYLNTWHGTPLKTLGRSMKQGLLEHENLARNFVQSTHLMAPNDLTRWALIDDHGIDAYYDGLIEVTGSPRLDRLVNDGEALREDIRRRLGVSPQDRLVLFAPTWRGGVASQDFDEEALLADLKSLSGIEGVRPFYRAHRLTEKFVRQLSVPVEVVPAEIDTNDLLAAVDVLVSDYSSITFDFMPTRRRLVLYVPDEEKYSAERGLYLELSDLPATVCRNREELRSALGGSVDPVSTADYEAAIARFAPLEDGRASKRVLDLMLTEGSRRDDRPLLVFHASLIANGIAAAFVALMGALTPDRFRVVLIVEAKVIRADEGRQLYLSRLPDHVNLAFRIGNIVASPEEQWAVSRRNEHDLEISGSLAALRDRAWSREAQRILGSATPSASIEFDGYATLWADLMASVGDGETRHLIWQHNQLVEEAITKYPELHDLFRRYGAFDGIIAVAKSLAEENRNELAALGYTKIAGIQSVPNVLPVRDIRALSEEDPSEDVRSWMEGAHLNVVSIGRLSPEKNFRALVHAWRDVLSRFPEARLTVLGDGLERAELEATAQSLEVSGSIRFFGRVDNPYPALGRADLFVLPSTHEGQPVVLFEAMVLNVPVACCFTPGSHEAIVNGYGRIISSDACGMADDLVRILDNLTEASGVFDAEAHRAEAVSEFNRHALR